jgi:hypothetical protein
LGRYFSVPCGEGSDYQVVKTYPGDPYSLYVTDYTQNTSLHSYTWSPGHNEWKGPFGKYTLQISCWREAADQANICKVGGYYIFKNVRIKLFPLVTFHVLIIRNRDGNLEGSLNIDQKFPHKIIVHPFDHFRNFQLMMYSADTSLDCVKAIVKRKRDYLIRLEATIQASKEKEEKARKRAREEYPSDNESQPVKSSQPQQHGSQQSSKRHHKRARQKPVEEEIVAPKLAPHGIIFYILGLNFIVDSDFPEKQPVAISQILSTNISTLRPRKMRIICRVSSFFPESIADFAAAWCSLCEQT